MAKDKHKAEKASRLRQEKRARIDKKKYANNRFVVKIRKDCGCCHAVLHFKDKESALSTLSKIGLVNGGIIVDDAGERHTGLDTFYGFV